jgi:hypothetical protein
MSSRVYSRRCGISVLVPFLLAACAPEIETGGQSSTDGDETVQITSALTIVTQLGMQVIVSDIPTPANLDLQRIVGLTACDASSLYAVVAIPSIPTTYGLHFSSNGGASWTPVQGLRGDGATFSFQMFGPEVACDHGVLVALNSGGVFFVARTLANGHLSVPSAGTTPWVQSGTLNPGITHIAGGDGTLYGTRINTSSTTLFTSSDHRSGTVSWSAPLATIGSVMVTGTGSIGVTTLRAWPRRAFTVETNGTVFFNDTILAGQNSWTFLDTASERFKVLAAARSNLLYGFQNNNGVKKLVKVELKEDSCADGVDNDADGRTDSEDPSCANKLATLFCQTHGTGNFCWDRVSSRAFLGQANIFPKMVRCTNNTLTSISVGACVHPGGTNDHLATESELSLGPPSGFGRYCNKHWSNGTWEFEANNSSTSDPCATISARKPGGVVVRAGLYSSSVRNYVFVGCNNGSYRTSGDGRAPLDEANGAVGHTANECIFQVSPAEMFTFSQPFELSAQGTTGVRRYNHTFHDVDLAQFGLGDTGNWPSIDRLGRKTEGNIPHGGAYDLNIPEGTPLYAMRGGRVVPVGGSRDRNVTEFACGGTPYQGELFVKYDVGTSTSKYQESFVMYYAHARRRFVEDNQTVIAGQLIGISGHNGCSSDPHLHISAARTSNINAHAPGNAGYGYRPTFETTPGGAGTKDGGWWVVDPFGWSNNSAQDPSGYQDFFTDSSMGFVGKSAWSIDLVFPALKPRLE